MRFTEHLPGAVSLPADLIDHHDDRYPDRVFGVLKMVFQAVAEKFISVTYDKVAQHAWYFGGVFLHEFDIGLVVGLCDFMGDKVHTVKTPADIVKAIKDFKLFPSAKSRHIETLKTLRRDWAKDVVRTVMIRSSSCANHADTSPPAPTRRRPWCAPKRAHRLPRAVSLRSQALARSGCVRWSGPSCRL